MKYVSNAQKRTSKFITARNSQPVVSPFVDAPLLKSAGSAVSSTSVKGARFYRAPELVLTVDVRCRWGVSRAKGLEGDVQGAEC